MVCLALQDVFFLFGQRGRSVFCSYRLWGFDFSTLMFSSCLSLMKHSAMVSSLLRQLHHDCFTLGGDDSLGNNNSTECYLAVFYFQNLGPDFQFLTHRGGF